MGHYCCGIYDKRPEQCRKYPERDSYQPEQCTFYFGDEGERKGSCDPECDSTCCRLTRVGGEPGGTAMPEIAGGTAGKYLEWVEEHPAHRGSAPHQEGPSPVADREGDQPETNPLKLALAEISSRKGHRLNAPAVGKEVRGRRGGEEG